jgi:hypothetical protein
VFVFCARSGRLLRLLAADEDVVNCVQGHPTEALLASSGIEDVVRLWAPGARQGGRDEAEEAEVERAVAANMSSLRSREGRGRGRLGSVLGRIGPLAQGELWDLLVQSVRRRGEGQAGPREAGGGGDEEPAEAGDLEAGDLAAGRGAPPDCTIA